MRRFLFNFIGAFSLYATVTAVVYLFFWLLRTIIDTGMPTWAVLGTALTGLSLMFALVMTIFTGKRSSLQE